MITRTEDGVGPGPLIVDALGPVSALSPRHATDAEAAAVLEDLVGVRPAVIDALCTIYRRFWEGLRIMGEAPPRAGALQAAKDLVFYDADLTVEDALLCWATLHLPNQPGSAVKTALVPATGVGVTPHAWAFLFAGVSLPEARAADAAGQPWTMAALASQAALRGMPLPPLRAGVALIQPRP